MKLLRSIPIVIVSAALGFALGKIGREPGPRPVPPGQHRPADGSDPAAKARLANDDALAPVFSALLARGDFRALARLGPLLDALDSAQMHALLDKLDKLNGSERTTWLPRLLSYWTKRDPQAATEWMQPRLGADVKERSFGQGFANFDTELVRAWAEQAPELALEYARQHAGTGLAEIALHNAIFSWPDKDNAHRFEIVRAFPPGKDRQKIVVSLCFSWAQKDRAGALAGAASLAPGPEREGALGEILARWAADQPADAFQKAQTLGIHEPAVLMVMAKEAAKSDPAATAHMLELQDPALLPQLGGVTVKFWAKKDPTAAFAWALEHGVSLLDGAPPGLGQIPREMFAGHAAEIGNESPLASAIREKPEATLSWLRTLPADADRQRYSELALNAASDVETMKSLLPELSPEAAPLGAARIAGALARANPAEGQQWANSLDGSARAEAWAALGAGRAEPIALPPGPDRDAMLRGLANAHATNAPAKALGRVLEIGDPALRRQAFDDVFAQLHQGPVELGHGATMSGATESARREAREWLENASVPEDWKEPWQ